MTEGFLLGILGSNFYFFLKMGMVFWLTKILQSKCDLRGLYALNFAWFVIQTFQTVALLGLSLFELLYPACFLAAILICAICLFWTSKNLSFDFNHFLNDRREKLIFLIILMLIALLWIRCQFLTDLTWDAQTYGLPRLSIWLNAKSVFVSMPTQQLNLFVNEWNAELNSLAYALASGSYVGFSFGNLEILVLFSVSIFWVATLLRASTLWALCLTAAFVSSPAIFGLASTVKGDLLGCTASILALGWLLMLWLGVRPILSFLLLFFSVALAVGSKMSVLLLSATLFVLGCIEVRKYRLEWLQVRWYGWASFLGALGALLSRFWMNWIQYGNPIKRVEIESAQFSLLHFVDHFKLIMERLLNLRSDLHGPKWALATGMSVTAWFILIFGCLVPIFMGYKKQSLKNLIKWDSFHQKIFIASFCILIGLMVAMMLSPAYVWSFRYFLPSLLILLLVLGCAWSENYYKLNVNFVRTGIVFFTVVFVGINLLSMLRWGEIFPAGRVVQLVSKVSSADTPLKRAFLFAEIPYTQVPVDILNLDGKSSKNILVFNELNASLLPFIGSYAQNRITTVAKGEDLVLRADQAQWDVLVIAQRSEFRDPMLLSKIIEKGYTLLANNALYVIAVPTHRVQLKLIKKFKDFTWELRDKAGSKKPANSKFLKLEKAGLSFVTQSLGNLGTVLIKARFDGEIVGGIWNTANLSLYGKEQFFILVKGNYKPTEPFYSVVDLSGGGNRLSFSLGDWEKGVANIRLADFEIFHLKLLSQ